MRTLAATRPQQLFWLLLSSQCHCRWPGEMTTLLALELALCCSNVTYRQPGYIYGNAVAFAAAVYSVRASPALQQPWPREQFGILRKLVILKRVTICGMCVRTYGRTYVRTPHAQTNSPLNTLVWGSLTLAQLT